MTKYLSFSGEAKRQEYWGLYILANVLVVTAILMLEVLPLLAFGVFALSIWLSLSVTTRRLRDAGLSIWWIVCSFVPYVSFIAAIVFGCVGSKTASE